MSSRFSPLFRLLIGSLAFFSLAFLGSFTRGQLTELPGNSMDQVQKEFDKANKIVILLLKGDTPFDSGNKEQTDAFEAAAKYDTYRFTWGVYQKQTGKMEEVYRYFEDNHFKMIQRNKTNQADVANGFTKAIIARSKEVLKLSGSPSAIARVNAMRVMAKMAEFGQPEMADALLEIFNQEMARPRSTGIPTGNERNEGVVYYALHGMRELLAIPQPEPPNKSLIAGDRERKLAEALIGFITKPPTFAKDALQDEIDGYRALRREAVHALAYCRAPDVKPKDRPGIVLMHIMARDGFTPEPRLDEALEAALGVARMRVENDGKEFQPEYAAYTVGQFVEYFGGYYNQQMKDEPRPFKIYAARLIEAIDAMKADSKAPYVAAAADQCRKLLLPIEKGEQVKTLDLANWLQANPPPKMGLFQDVPESTAKPPNRTTK